MSVASTGSARPTLSSIRHPRRGRATASPCACWRTALQTMAIAGAAALAGVGIGRLVTR